MTLEPGTQQSLPESALPLRTASTKTLGAFLVISKTPVHAANQGNESDFSYESVIGPYSFTLKNTYLEILRIFFEAKFISIRN